MTTAELAWLAGLLEGEGCFRVREDQRKRVRNYLVPRVFMNQTDEDVVRRAAKLAGVGRVYGPYRNGGNGHQSHYKPVWQFMVEGPDALWLMEQLYPYMGQRRQAKIDEILTEFEGSETTK